MKHKHLKPRNPFVLAAMKGELSLKSTRTKDAKKYTRKTKHKAKILEAPSKDGGF